MTYDETYRFHQHMMACVATGKGRPPGGAYSFPLGPPALKLIRKQQLLSNGELKRLLWNAVAMEFSCKVQRHRR